MNIYDYTKEDKPLKLAPLTPLDLEMILSCVPAPLMVLLLRLCFLTGTEIRYLLEMTYGDLKTISGGKLKIRLLYDCIPDIPINTGVQQLLQPYVGKQPDRDFLFTHDDGSTWTPAFVDGQVKVISEQSGLYFNADSLRMSYFNTVAANTISPAKPKARKKLYNELIRGMA